MLEWKTKPLLSSYLDSAKVQWMYTWSFCSERGKHVKCCWDAGMLLLSFVSHLTKSLTCMVYLSCVVLPWMGIKEESKTAKLLHTAGLNYYPRFKCLNLFSFIKNNVLNPLIFFSKNDATKNALIYNDFSASNQNHLFQNEVKWPKFKINAVVNCYSTKWSQKHFLILTDNNDCTKLPILQK